MEPLNAQPMPAAPAGEAAPEMSQDQMRSNLQDLMAKIQSKKQEFDAQKFSSDNQTKEHQGEILRQLFDLFQSNGVDPNSPEAVKAYLDELKANNPELYQQVEQALQVVLGEDQSDQPIAGQDDVAPVENNMNINTNDQVSQNL